MDNSVTDISSSKQASDRSVEASLHLVNESSPESLPIKILLAEDNLVNQKVALRVLKHLGYQADVVTNGLEVIQAIASKTYDLILMDIQMPDMDGLEATEYIRQQELENQSSPIAIVAITANATHDDQYICRKAGMNDYISKPIQIEKLKNILQKYVTLIN
ncbi:response regulator [Pseudanabaena sp. FACHB-1998]|uniref:response regulator n=1 Tax=Pseudanabaena sp. FACHB-1998 TaxID=2692858 RepID=UPI00168030C7|nr:response regulator [Pseudanabaena sp. FACHB-1998]MBD2178924.1 response regulator [Pseudanabaena sp. FACHB-1998]